MVACLPTYRCEGVVDPPWDLKEKHVKKTMAITRLAVGHTEHPAVTGGVDGVSEVQCSGPARPAYVMACSACSACCSYYCAACSSYAVDA